MRLITIYCFLSFAFGSLNAQVFEDNTIDQLRFYADVVGNAGDAIHRSEANRLFTNLFDSWVSSDAFDTKQLDEIKWISVKEPEDGSFQIATWQVKGENGAYKYFGYLFANGKQYQLKSTDQIDSDAEYAVMNHEEWIGVMYYNIMSIEKEGKTYYILFGYDGRSSKEHRKITDVLTFVDGEPQFGAEIFKREEEGKRPKVMTRLMIDYYADSNVSLNYNPDLEMIVMDHLIPRFGREKGSEVRMLPDGSYVGYKWDGSYFNYIDKIYHQVSNEAPMPKPILGKGSKNKNIFGKTQKKKNR